MNIVEEYDKQIIMLNPLGIISINVNKKLKRLVYGESNTFNGIKNLLVRMMKLN